MDCMKARATGIAGGFEPELAQRSMVRTSFEKNSRRPRCRSRLIELLIQEILSGLKLPMSRQRREVWQHIRAVSSKTTSKWLRFKGYPVRRTTRPSRTAFRLAGHGRSPLRSRHAAGAKPKGPVRCQAPSSSRWVRRLETTRRFCTLHERSAQSRTSRSLP